MRRPDDRTPRGQEYLGGAGRGGDSSEGTTFVAAEASDADNGGIFSWQRAWFMADWISRLRRVALVLRDPNKGEVCLQRYASNF